MRLMVPVELLSMVILPVAGRAAMTRLATVAPRVKLRLEALGVGVPAGCTVRDPAAVGLVAVRVRVAEAAVLGMPPRPVTWRVRAWWAARATLGAPLPVRVSRIRAGVRALKVPAGPVAAAVVGEVADVADVVAACAAVACCKGPTAAFATRNPMIAPARTLGHALRSRGINGPPSRGTHRLPPSGRLRRGSTRDKSKPCL